MSITRTTIASDNTYTKRELEALQAALAIDSAPTPTSAAPRVRTAGDSRGTHPCHVADYKERIDRLVTAAALDGYHTLVLAGDIETTGDAWLWHVITGASSNRILVRGPDIHVEL